LYRYIVSFFCSEQIPCQFNCIMKRKLKKWWPSIPTISTKRTVTLTRWTQKWGPQHKTGNPGPRLGQAQKYGGVIVHLNLWKFKKIVCNEDTCSVKPVLRGQLLYKEKVVLLDRWPVKRGSVEMKFSMTGQEKGDLIIQVTA